jgi:tRNA(Ile)-lysidine synthetase-like protein
VSNNDWAKSKELDEFHTAQRKIKQALSFKEELLHKSENGRSVSFLLAVSGGIDSMVLADGFKRYVPNLIHWEVAHVDHKLRATSERDATLVRDWCERNGVVFHLHCLHEKPLGLNVEAWARKARYTFFENIRIQQNLTWTITAHHAQDVIETFLMRLYANKEVKSIVAKDIRRKILRPLLGISKKDIAQYALGNFLAYHDDETNFDTTRTRNLFRHDILPYLREKLGVQLDATLEEQAKSLDNDLAHLTMEAKRLTLPLQSAEFGSKNWLRLLIGILKNTSQPLQWRVAEQALFATFEFPIGRNHALRFCDFCLKERRQVELPKGMVVRRKAGVIVVEKK